MKKIFAVLTAAFLLTGLLPAFSLAAGIVDSGDCGTGVTWTLDEDGLLTISGAGAMENYYNELSSAGAPWATPEGNAQRVRRLVVEDGVTSIGTEAFLSCNALESAELAGSVRTIGAQAFSGCSAMRTLVLEEGLTEIDGRAFFGCAALTSLTIPDSVTAVWGSAFHGCAGLTDIAIGHGLTEIGDSVFHGCSSLQSITIPEGIISIHPYAFYGCFALMDVTLPDSLETIGVNAFGGCGKLHFLCNAGSAGAAYAEENGVAFGLLDGTAEENTLSGEYNGVQWSIDRKTCKLTLSAQGNMPAFQSVMDIPWAKDVNKNYVHTATVSDGTTSIGALCFYGCEALTEVSVPTGVTSIGASAFNGCTSLPEIRLPDTVTSIGAFAFCGCTALTDVTFGAGVRTIGGHAFTDCSSLASVVIPNGVTNVLDFTFSGCLRMTDVTIPNTVTTIGAQAFAGSGLTEAVLPATVTTVRSRAFADCAYLYSITFYAPNCDIGENICPGTTRIIGLQDSDAEEYANACGLIFQEIDGTHTHRFVLVRSTPATCAMPGLNTYSCGCGAIKREVIPATGLHVQGAAERTVIAAATCVDAGEERITVSCTVCKTILIDNTYEIQPTGIHTPGEPAETVLTPATCTKTGLKRVASVCTVCGETLWETQVEIPTVPHRDDDGDRKCDVCGKALGDPCKYCGKVHDNTIIGRLQQLIHSIVYFFLHTFGR